MEIIISLIIVLTLKLLEGSILRGDVIYPKSQEQITTISSIKINIKHNLLERAVKSIHKGPYLLNIVTTTDTQKTTLTTIIQAQNQKIQG